MGEYIVVDDDVALASVDFVVVVVVIDDISVSIQ